MRLLFLQVAVVAVALAGLAPAIGCGRAGAGGGGSGAAGEVKTFPIRGTIVGVDAAKGSVILSHEAVPGLMGAMTMEYNLKQPGIASELHPGDRIVAKLVARKDGDQYRDAVLDEIVVTAEARPDYKPAVVYHVPQAGDAVPDFRLVNELGKPIRLGEFRGRVLLLTFIYTRCPLEDYCPRMNKNFAAIDQALKTDPTAYRQTHLLSISFDPEYDTPAILKSYGAIYTGGDARTFAHWDFAAPPEGELGAMERWFDVGVTPGAGGTLNHSLSTAVIGKDGKVRAWYPTNQWTPAEVLEAMKSAVAG